MDAKKLREMSAEAFRRTKYEPSDEKMLSVVRKHTPDDTAYAALETIFNIDEDDFDSVVDTLNADRNEVRVFATKFKEPLLQIFRYRNFNALVNYNEVDRDLIITDMYTNLLKMSGTEIGRYITNRALHLEFEPLNMMCIAAALLKIGEYKPE